MIELVKEHKLKPSDIEAIEVDFRLIPLLHTKPLTGLQGKFSMAFNNALGVLKGWSEIPDYTANRTQEPEVRTIMQKLRHVDDPADGSVQVTIVTSDGRRLPKNVKHAPGDPTFGLQEERTLNKYRGCAAYRLAPDAVKKVEHDLLNLEQVADLGPLMNALAGKVAPARQTVPA